MNLLPSLVIKKLCILIVCTFCADVMVAQKTWGIGNVHSNIGFNVLHFLIAQTTGYFKYFDARLISTNDDFNGAPVILSAKVASVFTDNKQRDRHLKPAVFLNAAKYPELTFNGTILKDYEQYLHKANPAISNPNITRPVIFAASCGGCVKDSSFYIEKAGFHIISEINRLDYVVLLRAAAQL